MQELNDQLKSIEAKRYIENLWSKSKPEEALSDAFFKGNSVLSQFLSPHVSPEVNVRSGFIDFKVGHGRKSFVLELKPLFEQEIIKVNGEPKIKSLKQTKLNWDDHVKQITKYLHKDNEFVVITNLKDWSFFNDKITVGGLKPFYSTDFITFEKDYRINHDPVDYLQREASRSRRGNLDDEFLASLTSWVKVLSEVDYELDDDSRDSLIIGLINKFIFIQTLDDFRIIDFQWLRKCWNETDDKWKNKGQHKVLEEFIREFMTWFEGFYDTELFSGEILEHIKNTEKNIEKFYNTLISVLGVRYDSPVIVNKGILQYDFRNIDEDVFGKAYETFLANRHDEAIYYTPAYISKFIVENKVEKIFGELSQNLKNEILGGNLDEAKIIAKKFVSIKVLDPSCGSGSFLVKTIKSIMKKYQEIRSLLLKEREKNVNASQLNPNNKTAEKITEIIQILKIENVVELLSAIILRHIHGNDLDSKALEIARVNLWLEVIKLAPEEFTPANLPKDSHKVLPHLEMNLTNGNSVVGMPTKQTIEILSKYQIKLKELSRWRNEYLNDVQDPKCLENVEKIKLELREKVDKEFESFLKLKETPSEILQKTKILHWALEFWHLYFDDEGIPLKDDEMGVDVLIGNPPYKNIKVIKKRDASYGEFLKKEFPESAIGNFDLAMVFVQKGYDLIRKDGEFGYIITNTFFGANFGKALRKFLSDNKAVNCIVNFGDQQVFEKQATTYTAILFLNGKENDEFRYAEIYKLEKTKEQLEKVFQDNYQDHRIKCGKLAENTLTEDRWEFIFKNEEKIVGKVKAVGKTLEDVATRISVGLQTSADDVYILEQEEQSGSLTKVYSNASKKSHLIESAILRKYVKGSEDMKMCELIYQNRVIIFPYKKVGNEFKIIKEDEMSQEFPKCFDYLKKFEGKLKKRADFPKVEWWGHSYPRNLDIFEKEKILTPYNAFEPSFAYDDVCYCYMGGISGGYGIIIDESYEISPSFLIGLLNSSLLGRYMIRKGGGTLAHGYISYEDRFIKNLPIVIPKTEKEKEFGNQIENSINQIRGLKKARKNFIEIWNDLTPKIKNQDFSLYEMLEKDADYLQDGTDPRWFDNVSFYPHKEKNNKLIEKKFESFNVETESDNLSIKILGVDEENIVSTIFEITFKDENLMQNVYLSILNLLNSKQQKKTLRHMLDKTKIPTIGPNPTNTMDIIRKISEKMSEVKQETPKNLFDPNTKFEELTNETTLEDIPSSILDIDKKIQEKLVLIDACVFKLYALEKDEVTIATDVIKLNSTEQGKILECFDKLQSNL